MLEWVLNSLYISLNEDPADIKRAFAHPWHYISLKAYIMARIYHKKHSTHVESAKCYSGSLTASRVYIALNIGHADKKEGFGHPWHYVSLKAYIMARIYYTIILWQVFITRNIMIYVKHYDIIDTFEQWRICRPLVLFTLYMILFCKPIWIKGKLELNWANPSLAQLFTGICCLNFDFSYC